MMFRHAVGHVLHVGPIKGTAWYMPLEQPKHTAHCGKVRLLSTPNGAITQLYWSTLKSWIETGTMRVGAAYPTWEDAVLALHPYEAAIAASVGEGQAPMSARPSLTIL